MTESSLVHISPWLASIPDVKQFPVLKGNHKADVVVIGGGMTGVLTAYHVCNNANHEIAIKKTGRQADVAEQDAERQLQKQ